MMKAWGTDGGKERERELIGKILTKLWITKWGEVLNRRTGHIAGSSAISSRNSNEPWTSISSSLPSLKSILRQVRRKNVDVTQIYRLIVFMCSFERVKSVNQLCDEFILWTWITAQQREEWQQTRGRGLNSTQTNYSSEYLNEFRDTNSEASFNFTRTSSNSHLKRRRRQRRRRRKMQNHKIHSGEYFAMIHLCDVLEEEPKLTLCSS